MVKPIYWIKKKPKNVHWYAPYRGPFSKKEAESWVKSHKSSKKSNREWIKSAKKVGIVGMKIRKLPKKSKYQIYYGHKEKLW